MKCLLEESKGSRLHGKDCTYNPIGFLSISAALPETGEGTSPRKDEVEQLRTLSRGAVADYGSRGNDSNNSD